MSCRTTPAGSAFTTYARLANGRALSDVATLSVFHQLRSTYQSRDPETRRVYTQEEYLALLDRQRDRVARMTGISEPRRQSILSRLDAARSAEMPDQGTLYALFNLNPTVRDRGNGLTRFIHEVSRTLEIEISEARTKFDTLENSIDRSRGGANPSTYTPENIAEARTRNLSTEAGTVHAMATLIQEMRQFQSNRALAAVQRIETRVPVDPPIEISGQGITVSAYGYDRYGRRLEITIIGEDGQPRNLAYRNVPESILEEENPVRFWEENILGNGLYMYPSQFEADLDSAAGRCSICGQFANNTHTCPVSAANVRTLSYSVRNTRQYINVVGQDSSGNEIVREIDVHLPAATVLRQAYGEAGAVRFDVSQWYSSYTAEGRYQSARVSGSLLAYRTEEGELAFSTGSLACSCETYRTTNTCEHIGYITQATRNRLVPPARARRNATPEEREALARERQALLEQEMAHDWSRKEEYYAEAKKNWASNSEVIYSEDFESFESVYKRALDQRRENNDTPVIPFEKGPNALGEYAKRGSGQAFGMEIEYEFPSNMDWSARRVAQEAIGRELFAAGLASSAQQQGYGASKRNGFRDTHVQPDGTSNWSWERDGSVNGGELVTPAMYDEPETWERLEKAVEILRRNGAIPSKKAGAHVHVGTAAYGSNPKPYAELSRLMTQHEDVMFRLAAEPKRGTHRNNGYSAVLPDVPVDGFQDIVSAKRWQGGRTRVLNMGGVSETDPNKSHVEFRIFDSTLDAGAMQAQIKLSVAMTNAALRISSDDANLTARPKEPKGSHANRLKAIGKRKLTGEQLKDDTATFRSLIDTLFTRKQDKDQLVSLFAQTKWTGGRR